VIVTVVVAVTAAVDTVKFALVAPGATVTVMGTAATAGLLVERETTALPAPAGKPSATVPVEPIPPATRFVFRTRDPRGGATESRPERAASCRVAEIFTVIGLTSD
jgi:hypothetical protein